MRLFADASLAARLETLAAEEMRRFVETARVVVPEAEAALLEIGGGVAVYLGSDSPVNQAMGLGLTGRFTAEQAEQLETFYAERSQRGLAVVSPLADPSLVASLSSRGWSLDAFENVLIREYARGESFDVVDGVEVIEADDDELKSVWADVASIAFSAPLEPLPAQRALARIVTARPGSCLLLALVNGLPAGTGEVCFSDGVAWLSADATLPQFRRKGVQQALQAKRLELGVEAGCEFAVSEALPGSPSQRNMERASFRVAYTRVDLIAPRLGGA